MTSDAKCGTVKDLLKVKLLEHLVLLRKEMK